MSDNHTPSEHRVHAEAWRAYAGFLADWANSTLVNRPDAFGAYLAKNKRRQGRSALTQKRTLTKWILQRHFAGEDVGHLVGIHSTSEQNTSRWLAIDFDNHEEVDAIASANFATARQWMDRLSRRNYRPILIDSDGHGGLHLWLLFDEPVPTPLVFDLGKELISSWQELGLDKAPEIFPKQPQIAEGAFGNWLRLPGRHHTRPHFARVWRDGWKAGKPAIEILLETEGRTFVSVEKLVPQHEQALVAIQVATARAGLPEPASNGRLSHATLQFAAGGAPEGRRNTELFKAAADLRGNGYNMQEIEEYVAPAAVKSGLARDEVERTVRSAAEAPRTPSVPGESPVESRPPFPTHVLPDVLRHFVEEAAEVFGCDESMVALPAIVTVAGAIGNSCRIRLREDWSEPSVIWMAVVATSGSLKSPVVELAVRPLNDLQLPLIGHTVDAEERSDESEPDGGEDGLARTIVADITLEALAVRLRENPRGLLVYRDELTSFFNSFDVYRRGCGSDESQFLLMHGARELIVDRKTGDCKTLYVLRAALSILGSVPPGALRNVLGRSRFESGLAARFLFVEPYQRLRTWTERSIPKETKEAYADLIRRAWRIPVRSDERNALVPNLIDIDARAKERWVDFYNSNASMIFSAVDPNTEAAYSKFEGYCARLALVLHVATCIGNADSPISCSVTPETMEAAVTITEWLRLETLRIYGVLAENIDDAFQRRVLAYVRRKDGSITVRDLQRAGFAELRKATEAKGFLDALVKRGYGIWLEPRGKGPNAGEIFKLVSAHSTPDS